MKARVDKDKCDRCGTCISVCAANALTLTDTLDVDLSRCTGCRSCIKVCPFGALSETAE